MDLNTAYQTKSDDLENGSAQLAGAAPGLQIRCGALEPSRVGSIPMHFRQYLTSITYHKAFKINRFRVSID